MVLNDAEATETTERDVKSRSIILVTSTVLENLCLLVDGIPALNLHAM